MSQKRNTIDWNSLFIFFPSICDFVQIDCQSQAGKIDDFMYILGISDVLWDNQYSKCVCMTSSWKKLLLFRDYLIWKGLPQKPNIIICLFMSNFVLYFYEIWIRKKWNYVG